MGGLHDFAQYIDNRRAVVRQIETRLTQVQAHYEAFYQEVSSVREHELKQLEQEIAKRKGALPQRLDSTLDEMRALVESEFDRKLNEMQGQHASLVEKAAACRSKSLELEQRLHQCNVDLDRREEALKARNAQLLAAIDQHNNTIRQMGSGFGFLKNIARMRQLQADRERIDKEQADVAVHIEALRAEWANRDKEHAARQAELQQQWTCLSTKASTLQAKIEHLTNTRSAVVRRSVLEHVLFDLRPTTQGQQTANAACPRCRANNHPNNSFCCVCAQRLKPDRVDLEGSLIEIAELNHHHRRFSDGMRACQELIGLVRGIGSGLDSFQRSIGAMIDNQTRYPLATLRIDVPGSCVSYGSLLDTLATAIEAKVSHPVEFAELTKQAISRFTEADLRKWFEAMGNELSKQARSQWG